MSISVLCPIFVSVSVYHRFRENRPNSKSNQVLIGLIWFELSSLKCHLKIKKEFFFFFCKEKEFTFIIIYLFNSLFKCRYNIYYIIYSYMFIYDYINLLKHHATLLDLSHIVFHMKELYLASLSFLICYPFIYSSFRER
jgi:hypothetical protein